MAFSCKVGSFNVTTAAAGNTVVITGLGFQPKAIIFFWTGETSATDAFSGGHEQRGVGVAASSTSFWAVTSQSENASAASDTDRSGRNDTCVVTLTAAGVIDGGLDLQSLDADGFTLEIINAFVVDNRIGYIALGGTDLTNVKAGSFQTATGTGQYGITGVGFQPDFVLFGNAEIVTVNTILTGNVLSVGAAVSSSEQGVVAAASAHALSTMNTNSYGRSGEIITNVGGAGFDIIDRVSLVSMDSDGFTLDQIEASGTAWLCFYLALKGGQYHVGNLSTSTTINDTIAVTGPGFEPSGVFLSSIGQNESAAGVVDDNARMNLGAFTSTTERHAQSVLDEDNVADSDIERAIEYDATLANISTTPAVVGLVDVQSVDSGGFTLVMDSADIEAAYVNYVAFGDAGGAATVDPYPYIGGGYYPVEG